MNAIASRNWKGAVTTAGFVGTVKIEFRARLWHDSKCYTCFLGQKTFWPLSIARLA